jgi:hypothetical protein
MESIFLTVKFGLFLAMTLFVVGAMGAALIAGLYQIVRDRIRREIEIPMGRSHLPTRAK